MQKTLFKKTVEKTVDSKLEIFLKEMHREIDPLGIVSSTFVNEQFWPSFRSLSLRERQIVNDLLNGGLSERKTAEKHGLKRTTVQVFKKRAVKKMKDFLIIRIIDEKLLSAIFEPE